jgi:hypothetical protein
MAVKLTISLECVDIRRAKLLMDGFLDAIEDGMGGGDQAKLGFTRKVLIGRRTTEVKDTFAWIYGEERPLLEELGFPTESTPAANRAPDTLDAFRRLLDEEEED